MSLRIQGFEHNALPSAIRIRTYQGGPPGGEITGLGFIGEKLLVFFEAGTPYPQQKITPGSGGFEEGFTSVNMWSPGNNVKGIAYNGSRVVAGSDGRVSYSDNEGSTGWTTALFTGTASFPIVLYGPAGFLVYYTGTRQVSMSSTGASFTNTWISPMIMSAGTVFKGLYILTGNGYTYYTSPDGVSWTARTCPVSLSTTLTDILHSGTLLVVSRSGTLAYSSDGINWTSRAFTGGNTTVYSSITLGGQGAYLEIGSAGIKATTDIYSAGSADTFYSHFKGPAIIRTALSPGGVLATGDTSIVSNYLNVSGKTLMQGTEIKIKSPSFCYRDGGSNRYVKLGSGASDTNLNVRVSSTTLKPVKMIGATETITSPGWGTTERGRVAANNGLFLKGGTNSTTYYSNDYGSSWIQTTTLVPTGTDVSICAMTAFPKGIMYVQKNSTNPISAHYTADGTTKVSLAGGFSLRAEKTYEVFYKPFRDLLVIHFYRDGASQFISSEVNSLWEDTSNLDQDLIRVFSPPNDSTLYGVTSGYDPYSYSDETDTSGTGPLTADIADLIFFGGPGTGLAFMPGNSLISYTAGSWGSQITDDIWAGFSIDYTPNPKMFVIPGTNYAFIAVKQYLFMNRDVLTNPTTNWELIHTHTEDFVDIAYTNGCLIAFSAGTNHVRVT